MCGRNVPGVVQGSVMSAVLEEHVFRGVGDGTCTCVRNDSVSASTSLSASLVFLERRSRSCRVIRPRILANCANMSKRKGALSPREGFFFKNSSKRISFYFSLSLGTGAWTSAAVSDVVGGCAPLGIWSYYHKYCLPEHVPTGCEIAGCIVKASFSSSESLREAIVTESSSVARETALHNVPLSLGLLVSISYL